MPNVEQIRKRREAEAFARDEAQRAERRKIEERERIRVRKDQERHRVLEMSMAKVNEEKAAAQKKHFDEQDKTMDAIEAAMKNGTL